MKVRIVKEANGWTLYIIGHGNYLFWWHKKLIDAIDMADSLGVHVDNIDSLPITQYKQGAVS